jgi:putative restriction endonuclease
MPLNDQTVRLAAFRWLEEQVAIHGETLTRELLQKGFELEGEWIPLLGPQGIFKPRVLREIPLSITSAPEGPYDDSFSREGLLEYRYRGTDPYHRDNVGLRLAMQNRAPLVYLFGLRPGRYLATWPVYIVHDNPDALTFTVQVDDVSFVRLAQAEPVTESPATLQEEAIRRTYITRLTKQRLHQQSFRERVLEAYRDQCSLCRLKYQELLDAAHIVPDADPEGVPTVNNGIALCKLHHAAFDSYILGISPDHMIYVRQDILDEHDGPMLLHGLQGLNGQRIILPSARESHPDRHLLEKRFELFRRAV